jgi:hypothetical protein
VTTRLHRFPKLVGYPGFLNHFSSQYIHTQLSYVFKKKNQIKLTSVSCMKIHERLFILIISMRQDKSFFQKVSRINQVVKRMFQLYLN